MKGQGQQWNCSEKSFTFGFYDIEKVLTNKGEEVSGEEGKGCLWIRGMMSSSGTLMRLAFIWASSGSFSDYITSFLRGLRSSASAGVQTLRRAGIGF